MSLGVEAVEVMFKSLNLLLRKNKTRRLEGKTIRLGGAGEKGRFLYLVIDNV